MTDDYADLLNMTDTDAGIVSFDYPTDIDYEFACQPENITYYPSVLGTTLAMPEWEAVITALALTFIILLTIVGNILVILSVFTYKPLRIVQNFFIVSLAVADLTVAILVLPFNVAYSILGRWDFGIHVCKMWLTSDILCCTASILNLCAIALDRYWAITDPINYAQQRTFKRVLIMIVGVWLLSGLISSPPLIGWNDWPNATEWTSETPCALTSQQGYVVYSSLGSFYIPLFIMTIVYVEIFIATKRRLRDRAKASQLNMVKQNVVTSNPQAAAIPPKDQQAETSQDRDSISSETKHDEHVEEVPSGKSKEKKRKAKKKQKQDGGGQNNRKYLAPMLVVEDSITDNHDSPSGSQHGGQSLKCADDGHTTTTNTDSPRSRTREVPSPAPTPVPAAAAAIVLPKKSPVYSFIEEKQRISLSKERRAARTLGIIMGVFVFCWLPFFLMYVILPFCSGCCPSEKFKNFITWLGYINSALNPIIYTIFNLDFRRAFKKLLHMKP